MPGEQARNRLDEDEPLDTGARPDFDESLLREELVAEVDGFSTPSLYESERTPTNFDMEFLRHADGYRDEERGEVY